MFKVVYQFADLEDDGYIYQIGDDYPRKGVEPLKERILELSSKNNKIGKPLIEEIKDRPKKKSAKADK